MPFYVWLILNKTGKCGQILAKIHKQNFIEITPEGIVLFHVQNWTYTRLMFAFRSCFANPPNNAVRTSKDTWFSHQLSHTVQNAQENTYGDNDLRSCAKTLSTIT